MATTQKPPVASTEGFNLWCRKERLGHRVAKTIIAAIAPRFIVTVT